MDILDVEPRTPSATELLYNKYGGMLFSFILQFEADRPRAEGLLADIFSKLHHRLEDACTSSQSLYCWLQVEARKIVLESRRLGASEGSGMPGASSLPGDGGELFMACGPHDQYYALLQEASVEQRWVFIEMYLYGRSKEELAVEAGRDVEDIDNLLRESLLVIRKKLS
jgi:DNA-directed RNA polymerase specialized sigma24 family protein